MACKCGSQIVLCNLPIRFDTYVGCSHGCRYCFVQKKNGQLEAVKKGDTVESLKAFVQGKRSGETAWCDWNIPIHWGGITLHPNYEAKTMQWFVKSGLDPGSTLFWIVGAAPRNIPAAGRP